MPARPQWYANALLAGVSQCSCPTISRSEEHTSELQSRQYLVCRLLLEKKKIRFRHDTLLLDDRGTPIRTESHTSEIQSRHYLVCLLLLNNKNKLTCQRCSTSCMIQKDT